MIFQMATSPNQSEPSDQSKPIAQIIYRFANIKTKVKNWWDKLDPSWKTGTLVFLIARIWLTIIGAVIFFTGWFPRLCDMDACQLYWGMTPVLTGWRGALLGMWQRWDTLHYQVIATSGYSSAVETAFFPGYPLLAHAVSIFLHISELATLLLVSNIFCWLCFVFLHRVTQELFDLPTARKAVIFLAVFPTSFFLFGGYPQSMILFFTLFCYWQAKNGNWFLASLAAFLAGLTHGTIIPLCLMLAWQVFVKVRKTRFSIYWVALMTPFLPLAGIALFLAWRTSQGFVSYAWVQSFFHERIPSLPWTTLIAEFSLLTKSTGVSLWLNFWFLIFTAVVAIWSIYKLPVELKIFSVSTWLFFLFTRTISDPLKSIARFSLMIFPIFIMLAIISKRNFFRFLLPLSASLFSVLAVFFFLWGWIG